MRMNEMIAKDENVVMLELIPSSSTMQYASTVFADLPKYLARYLENVQKRALSIIWPGILYETALAKLHYPLFLTVWQSRVPIIPTNTQQSGTYIYQCVFKIREF